MNKTKLHLKSEEDLDDYYDRTHELRTRLSEAGEAITDRLFNALVINGLHDSYELYVVQRVFNQSQGFLRAENEVEELR